MKFNKLSFWVINLIINYAVFSFPKSLPDSTEFLRYKRNDAIFLENHTINDKAKYFPLQSTGIWTELNPRIPRVDYLGVHFVNKDTGWACGDLGAIIKTTDGGQSWTVSETNTTTPILKVRSFNGQTVIASGFNGTILRSTDGGEIFEQVTSNVIGDLWGLQMLNDTLGWACGTANSLIKTTDGGLSWQHIETPGYTSDYWWIDFLTESYGFIAANGKMLRTIDGGENWEIIQAGDNQPLFSVDVIDSLHIAAAGYGGIGYGGKNIYSSDGGYTWINGGTVTTHEINCIKYINTDTGYIVMSEIGIYKTTNQGQNWNFIPGIEGVGEYELSLLPENSGYSVGTNLKIYKTENGYDYWKRLIINDNFSDVFFVSEQKGFVISTYASANLSGLYKTEDGGINWERVTGAPNGVDLLFIDSLTGFIGRNNAIYKTTDGGVSWYQTQGTTGAGKIYFINKTTGWATSGRSIIKTTDGGENWFVQITHPSDTYTSIFFIDSLNGWATSFYIWQTTNGGNNWIQRTDVPIYFSDEIYFIDTAGFIIEFRKLHKSLNSGNNWFTQLNSQYIIRSFGWLNKQHGFIVGDGVYETLDGGNTWNEILELRNVGLRKFHAPKNYIGYSTGYLGLIYKYLDTLIIPVELISFSANVQGNIITLRWLTASESNNYGFEIFKSVDLKNWKKIGFIKGQGTSTLIGKYEFIDNVENFGKYYYKLKQIDYNGTFNFSNIIEVTVASPTNFKLNQNFPNPFNPLSKISFEIPVQSNVKIVLYDMLGKEIKVLLNGNFEAGYHTLNINAIDLSSGIYFYCMTTDKGYTSTKKLTIIK